MDSRGRATPSTGLRPRDALEGKAPQRRPQQRLGRRLDEVAEAVGGGYCRLQMPLRLALGVRGTVAECVGLVDGYLALTEQGRRLKDMVKSQKGASAKAK